MQYVWLRANMGAACGHQGSPYASLGVGILHWYQLFIFCFFFSSRRRHTRCLSDWSSDVCSSDLMLLATVSQAPYCRGGVRQAIGDRTATLLSGFLILFDDIS